MQQLQAEVAAAARQLERRDTEGVLRHVSEQYRTGPFTKSALRAQLQAMFAIYDAMKVRVRLDMVRMVGDHAWVYSSGELSGHFAWLDRWVSVLSWQRELEVARREGGVWRLFGYQR
jgi:S-formylglutathione hydrolase FrmB